VERPTAETIAAYEAALPDDPRVVRGQMFGHPCAFVNGHMFFGTFAQTVVARVGAEQVQSLVAGGARVFEPMSGRAWSEYVQLDVGDPQLPAISRAALEATARLAPKEKRSARKKS
jgi:hypothetical protein